MGIEDLIFTTEGAELLLFFFIPGFVTISCLRHWMKRLNGLNQLEMIFWSIPLSVFLSVISQKILISLGAYNTPESATYINTGPPILASGAIFTILLFTKVFIEERGFLRISYWFLYIRKIGFWKFFKRLWRPGIYTEKCPVCKKKVENLHPYEIYHGEKTHYDKRIGRKTWIIAKNFMCVNCTRHKKQADYPKKAE